MSSKIESAHKTNVEPRHVDVVVVGSGISGLRTAHNLHAAGKSVVILEAMDYVGGRIRQDQDFFKGVNVELGAEIVHGKGTSLTDFADSIGEPYNPIFCWAHGDGGPLDHAVNGKFGLYYVDDGSQKKLLRFDTNDEEFTHLNKKLEDIDNMDDDLPADRTLKQFLKDENVSEAMLRMADAGYANTFCTHSDDLSINVASRATKIWSSNADEGDFKFPSSFKVMINHYKKDLEIHTSSPVVSIEYPECPGEPAKVFCHPAGSNEDVLWLADRVVVTTSVSCLQRELISFNPPLPSPKLEAIHSLRMRTAMKVNAKFSAVCWPSTVQGMIFSSPTLLFPEIWFTDLSKNSQDPVGVCYATGFVASRFADKLLTLSEDEIYKKLVEQIATFQELVTADHWRLPGEEALEKAPVLPDPASVFVGGRMEVWDVNRKPYVGGGYSSFPLGSDVNCSAELGKPVNSVLFFAGEATTFPNSTVHSAMDSAIRVTKEILSSFPSSM